MKSILLVENNDAIREILAQSLPWFGYKADTVSSLIEARNAMQSNSYDLLMISASVDDNRYLDSLSFLQKLREGESVQDRNIPILITGSDVLNIDEAKMLARFNLHYSLKFEPITELTQKIKSIMKA